MLTELRTKILTDVTISGLVGTNVFPYHIPQTATLPAISMNIISRVNDPSLQTGKAQLTRIRVQIDTWSTLYSDCETMADALETLLDGFQGDLSGINVGETTLEGSVETWEPVEGDDQGTYSIKTDFVFFIAN